MTEASRSSPARSSRFRVLAVAVIALGSLALKDEPFRYAREVQASPGWAVLELPDDVLALARPGLGDVRLETKQGELGYVLEEALLPVAPRVELHDVESVPGRETRALLDRGQRAPLCREIVLEVAGTQPFLKPVVLEASTDAKDFQEIAKSSIFRLENGLERSRVAFAPSDRRFLRIRLDDRNGDPVRPIAARCSQATAPEAPLRNVAVALERTSGSETLDGFVLRLPSANLPVVELQLSVAGLAFARDARVYERVLFREQISRRLVGSGRLERSATGTELTTVPLSEISGSVLELEIDRAGAPLEVQSASAAVRPKRLIFAAPNEPGLTLRYGSAGAAPPRYDLAEALSRGRPSQLATATLGPVRDSQKAFELPPPARAALEPSGWKRRAPLVLPTNGKVAFLDLEAEVVRHLHTVRILDAAGRQVPFVVETEPRLRERPLAIASSREGSTTRLTLSGFDPKESVSRIELDASAPDYFERPVRLFVETKDRRGVTGTRELGSVHWRKPPGSTGTSVAIPVALEGEPFVFAEIDDGDNPPLTLTRAVAEGVLRRIDFLFEPGEKLELLWDNASASTPRYDLGLIASAVLERPAFAATLAKTATPQPKEPAPGAPKWFWWVAVASGLLVVLALFRVRRADA
ncbi:MAG TPA: DUF3999 family protein [Polyangiaceae bacterium]